MTDRTPGKRRNAETVHVTWAKKLHAHADQATAIEARYKAGSNAATWEDWPDSYTPIAWVDGVDPTEEMCLEIAQELWDRCHAHAPDVGGRVYFELVVLGPDKDGAPSILGRTSQGGFLNVTGDVPTRAGSADAGDSYIALLREWERISKFQNAAMQRLYNAVPNMMEATSNVSVQALEQSSRAMTRMEQASGVELAKTRMQEETKQRMADYEYQAACDTLDAKVRVARAHEFGQMGRELVTQIAGPAGSLLREQLEAFLKDFMGNMGNDDGPTTEGPTSNASEGQAVEAEVVSDGE